jgi:hypothetical protein
MPIGSFEIAQMAGAYAQMHMGNVAYAQQIGMGGLMRGFGMNSGMNADNLMGGIASRGAAVGAPMMQGMMGMMGMDPMSLGLRAAQGVWGMGGGVLGAGLAGAGVAAGAGLGMAAVGFAGNQVYTGMQQQAALNQGLRSNFSFMNGSGSQGFNRSEMGMIGSHLRQMSHEFGSGGEIASFGELSHLVQNMGRMDLSRGVRDVQEFKQRFKTMVDTLKTVSKELGTSLEEAQQFMSSMRGSGLFHTSDQLKFSAGARSTALSGGLALSEVTSMANIGAQISRSVGGLGRSGAFGGMKAIGQVGTALQMGALTEEDIYNSTGLTGAEGRQAFASNALQRDASFLKTGKGRRLLAAMADKNGNLDESSVAEFMGGGFDVSRTISLDHQQLGKVGRANFIRNEGRLRGAMLEKFGGNVNTMALMGWASGKGIDINDMDDRSMLFAQRQLGMGRDEMDAAVKMAQKLPEILREQQKTQFNDAYSQKIGDLQKTTGLSGIKNRFAQARETVQGKLQAFGSELFQEGSEMIERYLNELSGTYVTRISREAESAFEQATSGLGGKSQTFQRSFGDISFYGGNRNASGIGGMQSGRSAVDAFTNRGPLGFLGLGESQRDKYEKAGYNFSGMDSLSGSDKAHYLKRRLGEIDEAAVASQGIQSKELYGLTGGNEGLRDVLAFGSATGGDQSIAQFGAEVERQAKKGDAKAQQLNAAWQAAKGDMTKQAQIMSAAAQGNGLGQDLVASRLTGDGSLNSFSTLFGSKGNFRTEGERQEAYFKAFTGRDAMGASGGVASKLAGIGGGITGFLGGLTLGPAGAVYGAIKGYQSGRDAAAGGTPEEMLQEKQMMSVLGSDKYAEMTKGIFSQDAAERGTAMSNLADITSKLDRNSGEFKAYQGLAVSKMAADAREQAGGNLSEDAAQGILDKMGINRGELHGQSAKEYLESREFASKGMALQGNKEAYYVAAERVKQASGAQSTSLIQSGFAQMKDGHIVLSSKAEKSLAGDDLVKSYLSSIDIGKSGDLASYADAQSSLHDKMGSMSVDDMLAEAKKLRASGEGNLAAQLEMGAGHKKRVSGIIAKKGAGAAFNSELGLGLDKKDEDALNKTIKSGSLGDAKAAILSSLQSQGITLSSDTAGVLSNAIMKAKGDPKQVSGLIETIKGDKGFQDAETKKAKAEDAAKNPILAEMRDALNKMVLSSKNTETNTKNTIVGLDGIAAAVKSGPEDK